MHTLRKIIQEHLEWSMGCGGDNNEGQCPVCHAVSPAWIFGKGGWGNRFGHRMDCPLAQAIEADGGEVVWEQEVKKE